MKENSEYRSLARMSLSGKWAFGAIASIICWVIMCAPGELVNSAYDIQLGQLWGLFVIPLSWGYGVLWLALARNENVDYGMLFDGFKDYLRIFLTLLLVQIYTILWMLLLIIPGLVKCYSYSMTSFILKDNPEMKYDAAINESMRMMQGHKMKLFLLDLSFIGWFFLSILTLGIGFLFLQPYMSTAHAHFYEDLKTETL
ncbi:MAG: DUF975 family protein [Prevotellaceae bacterium]|nr:DUF975 family protein [Prevotellaceae bacterium]MDY2749224.1 DUF975 family protein [Prevotella sp.]